MRAKKPKKLSAAQEAERQAKVRAAFGMFSYVNTRSMAFALRKAEEIQLEDSVKRS
ncbi:MAG: hypothetical protein Q8922_12440 [Bacteroidota bacterium]|nr:hypothetical protein [Bacteroidota bacterium]MDP4232205.1 hypothetical protein [Bacteroidota bacterium]MDP4243614.1 hypothetical protein [Bacteroidota bacterium]MDP4288733.1 hypothetical protein [Bacteroidota bacterium]